MICACCRERLPSYVVSMFFGCTTLTFLCGRCWQHWAIQRGGAE